MATMVAAEKRMNRVLTEMILVETIEMHKAGGCETDRPWQRSND
jgi:hypothetical protein